MDFQKIKLVEQKKAFPKTFLWHQHSSYIDFLLPKIKAAGEMFLLCCFKFAYNKHKMDLCAAKEPR